MNDIRKLVSEIREELHDAEKYARCALRVKEEDVNLYALYTRLAGEEMQHMELLRNAAVEKINTDKRRGVEGIDAVARAWEWEHECITEHAAEVRAMIATLK